jgi:hypothetical protein
MFRSIAIVAVLCFATISAQAALLGRAALTPGGTDYQAYYDDVLNITWMADADYAKTSGYDADGLMTWSASLGWIASLNSANHLGVSYWRLPTVIDSGTPGCNVSYVGTDCGYNMDVSTGEMTHLFYSTLGNTGYFDTGGLATGCSGPGLCLSNDGPFSNLAHPYANVYWSGIEYAPDTTLSWTFYFDFGNASADQKVANPSYAWAVTDGDALAVVPIPAAACLFGSALGLMGAMRRKISS